MSKSNLPIVAVVALSAGMLFAATEIASAQKKTDLRAGLREMPYDRYGRHRKRCGAGGLTSIFARRSVHEEVRFSAEEIGQLRSTDAG